MLIRLMRYGNNFNRYYSKKQDFFKNTMTRHRLLVSQKLKVYSDSRFFHITVIPKAMKFCTI